MVETFAADVATGSPTSDDVSGDIHAHTPINIVPEKTAKHILFFNANSSVDYSAQPLALSQLHMWQIR